MLTVGYAQNCLSDAAAVSPTHAAVGHSAAASSFLSRPQIARPMPPQACFLTQRCIFANFPLFSSSLSPSALQPRPHQPLLHHPLTAPWLRSLITPTQSSSPHTPTPAPHSFLGSSSTLTPSLSRSCNTLGGGPPHLLNNPVVAAVGQPCQWLMNTGFGIQVRQNSRVLLALHTLSDPRPLPAREASPVVSPRFLTFMSPQVTACDAKGNAL